MLSCSLARSLFLSGLRPGLHQICLRKGGKQKLKVAFFFLSVLCLSKHIYTELWVLTLL